MRVAWIGPTPGDEDAGGVSYAATVFIRSLRRAGVELDCYVPSRVSELPASLLSEPGLTFTCKPPRWEWNRWYSSGPLAKFTTGLVARGRAQARLVERLQLAHEHDPYDLVYQFSNVELVGLRGRLRSLPPVIVHPEVHAAGELRCHRAESALARRCESRIRHAATRCVLAARTAVQRRDAQAMEHVIAPSRQFATEFSTDYRVPRSRIRVVPNPVDVELYSPGSNGDRWSSSPLVLLFVARMSVRKGVELIVDLSHRLDDLAGKVEIRAIGAETQWSNYVPLLSGLNPRVASYLSHQTQQQLRAHYRRGHLLLQPSHYEPFSLTVAEGLASGMPVVASTAVGASENVDRECCRVFAPGDISAFEREVRDMVAQIFSGNGPQLSALARSEAERCFGESVVGAELAKSLSEMVAAHPAT